MSRRILREKPKQHVFQIPLVKRKPHLKTVSLDEGETDSETCTARECERVTRARSFAGDAFAWKSQALIYLNALDDVVHYFFSSPTLSLSLKKSV